MGQKIFSGESVHLKANFQAISYDKRRRQTRISPGHEKRCSRENISSKIEQPPELLLTKKLKKIRS